MPEGKALITTAIEPTIPPQTSFTMTIPQPRPGLPLPFLLKSLAPF